MIPPVALTFSKTACAPAWVRLAEALTTPVSALVVPISMVLLLTPGPVAPPPLDDDVDPPQAAATSARAAAASRSRCGPFISSPP